MPLVARTFRLPEELWAALDVVAAERGQTRSMVLRLALEEALGGSRVGTPGQGSGLPKGPVLEAVAPAPPPRASAVKKASAVKDSAAKSYRAPDPVPVPVEFGRRGGKRPGGFVPRPKGKA